MRRLIISPSLEMLDGFKYGVEWGAVSLTLTYVQGLHEGHHWLLIKDHKSTGDDSTYSLNEDGLQLLQGGFPNWFGALQRKPVLVPVACPHCGATNHLKQCEAWNANAAQGVTQRGVLIEWLCDACNSSFWMPHEAR